MSASSATSDSAWLSRTIGVFILAFTVVTALLVNATVYFETAGTTLKFDEKTDAIIRTLCASMMADDNLKAEITGHTDNKGSAAINLKYA